MNIRKEQASDINQITNLHNQAFDGPDEGKRSMETILSIKKRGHLGILKQMFSKRQLITQFSLVIEKFYQSKLIKYFLQHLRVEGKVMRKYDRMAGKYIDIYNNAMNETENHFVVYDNKYELMPLKKMIQAREDYLSDLIASYSPKNCIEIGAGELTFITPIAAKLDKVAFSALELSWSRLSVGKEFARKYNVNFEHLVMGSVENLPFPDNNFDIVITHHCLEQIRGNLEHILSELYRISRKAIIILEPSADLGNWFVRQQLRMNQRVRGIKKVINKLGYNLTTYEWFPYSNSYLNRTGMYIIEKNTDNSSFPKRISYVCPSCKELLQLDDTLLFCEKCGIIYPIIKDIPCLNETNGILANKFSMT